MCLALLAFKQNAEFPLVLAHNRDEYWARPSLAAAFHHPGVLSGIDGEKGGTWLGVTESGRFAFVTNLRNPSLMRANRMSRGALVGAYLASSAAPAAFLADVVRSADAYRPFNLVVGTLDEVWTLSTLGPRPQRLPPGLYAFSNGPLDLPGGTAAGAWPKTRRAKSLYASLPPQERLASGPLFTLLADRHPPRDEELPQTGIPFELERALGPIFVALPGYGTRCATVVRAAADGNVNFDERRFHEGMGPSAYEASHFQFVTRG